MPTYEYKCNQCGHQFEIIQTMSDQPLEICPKCQGQLTKIVSFLGGFILKGDGFYANDYKKKT